MIPDAVTGPSSTTSRTTTTNHLHAALRAAPAGHKVMSEASIDPLEMDSPYVVVIYHKGAKLSTSSEDWGALMQYIKTKVDRGATVIVGHAPVAPSADNPCSDRTQP